MRQSLPFLLAVLVTACGAESPTPPATQDAGQTDASTRADVYLSPCATGRDCGPRFACAYGACRPSTPDACGMPGRACATGQVCAVTGDDDGGTQIICTTP